jgi:RNA polymerase sigma-70 factor (ECF subfamily)
MAIFKTKYKTATDEELLHYFLDGDEKPVIEQFYKRYAHLIMGTALKYCRSTEDAEDIVMTIYLHLADKLRKHSVQNFKAWLHMVTKNECLMQLRKKNYDIPYELKEFSLKQDEEEYDSLTDIQIQLVLESLNDLKEPQRACVYRFYIEKNTYAEIAQELHLDINTVKSAIQNGKRNIKLKLSNRNEFI